MELQELNQDKMKYQGVKSVIFKNREVAGNHPLKIQLELMTFFLLLFVSMDEASIY